MTVRLKDIAKIAKVSEATVSLALNDNKLVNENTKLKIKKIANELGYTVNSLARSLVKQTNRTIGVVIPDIENPYYSQLVKYLDSYIKEAGYNTIIAISNDKPKIESSIINNFISEHVEGVIIVPINNNNKNIDYINLLNDNNIPFIFSTSYYPGIDAPYVMVDLEDGMYKLVKYLIDLGHRKIYFICGFIEVLTTYLRLDGYLKAFKEKNIEPVKNFYIECTRVNYDDAQKATLKLINENTSFDAIIAINDLMAIGVLNVLKKNGYLIPEDVSLAGYDNTLFSSIASIPITTVSQDLRLIGRNSVDMIINKIDNKVVLLENVLMRPELIIRETTHIKKLSLDISLTS